MGFFQNQGTVDKINAEHQFHTPTYHPIEENVELSPNFSSREESDSQSAMAGGVIGGAA